MAPNLHKRLAARKAVMASRMKQWWRREAPVLRKGAAKAGQRTAETLHRGWLVAKPRAVEAGRRGAAAARKAARKGWNASKPYVIKAEEKVEQRLVALLRRLRPTV